MTALAPILAAFAPPPRRYPIEHHGHIAHYGPWRIYFDPPPIPSRNCDWHFWHEDFDGPGDNRCGACASFADALNDCDEIEDER